MQEIDISEILAGDIIRVELTKSTGMYRANEYVARWFGDSAGFGQTGCGNLYFLIERPVKVPTEPGHYKVGSAVYTLNSDGQWYFGSDRRFTEIIVSRIETYGIKRLVEVEI